MPKLTKSYVDRLVRGPKRYAVRCSDLRGFEIRVNRDGTKTASVLYFQAGRQRRVTLGRLCETYTLAQARTDAAEVLIEAKRGRDLAGERAKLRSAPTFAQAAELYLTKSRRRCSASTLTSYESVFRRMLLPAFGSRKVTDISAEDIERFQAELKGSPAVANLALAVLSATLGHAEKLGHCASNPCRLVERLPTRPRERVLSHEERARLIDALDAAEHSSKNKPNFLAPAHVAAIRLLVLTGCRSSEITKLTWSEVDIEAGVLRLEESKTGPRPVPLSDYAVAYLRKLREASTGIGFVCPTHKGNRVRDLWRAWNILRARCGLEDLRIHDLRRSAATSALEAGVGTGLISKILGHSTTRTTEIYLRPRADAQREAARRMGEAIEASTKTGAEKLREKK